ncbi:Protein CYSTEINE-RICH TRANSMEMBRANE MODULE 6, partial [Linum grandiflorum]
SIPQLLQIPFACNSYLPKINTDSQIRNCDRNLLIMGHNDDHPAPAHSAYPPPGQAYPPPQGSEYPPPGQAYPPQPPPPQYQPYPAPPPPQQAAYYPPNPQAPPPAGYPPVLVDHGHQQQPPATNTQNKGDGFLKGCAAAICCCFAFEICCD